MPDACPGCGKPTSNMQYGTFGRGPVLKGRTRFVSEAMASAIQVNKSRYEHEVAANPDFMDHLNIPPNAPDAPDMDRVREIRQQNRRQA